MTDQPQASHSQEKPANCFSGFCCRQVKPHFLFNALSLISASTQENPCLAKELVLCLADLLRAGIGYEESEHISLDEELNLVKSYLVIEKERFPGRFVTLFDAKEGLPASVPAFTLMKLAEYLLRETVLPCGGGAISITAAQSGGMVRCEVAAALIGGGTCQPCTPLETTPFAMIDKRLSEAFGSGLGITSVDGIPVQAEFTLPVLG